MNKKTITGVMVLTAFLSSLAGGTLLNQDAKVYYCKATDYVCVANYGVSGGSHTRCYDKQYDNWWDAPYCKEGWELLDTGKLPNNQRKIPKKEECFPPPVNDCIPIYD